MREKLIDVFDKLECSHKIKPYKTSSKKEPLNKIIKKCSKCSLCSLYKTRKNIVFGSGSETASLLFVGEAPGASEDETGLPFVGRAGKLLTRLLDDENIKRDEVYITNVVKCRPPGNRNPSAEEIEKCGFFLSRQLKIINPAVICALGTFAAQTLIGTKEPISKLRGKIFEFENFKLIAAYHPAAALYNPSNIEKIRSDIKKLRILYKG